MNVEDKILEKAHELFIKQGLKSVTMDNLAQALGISKRTIYEHFKDKKALVEEDAKYFYKLVKTETDNILNSNENAIYGLMKIVRYITGIVQQVNPLYFSEMQKNYSLAYAEITEKGTKRRYNITTWLVKKGIEQGIFRSDINIDLVASFVKKFMLYKNDLLKEIPVLYYGDFERDILFSYLRGISTQDGREMIDQEEELYFKQMSYYGTEIQKFKF